MTKQSWLVRYFGGLMVRRFWMNDAPAAQVAELFADVDDLIRRVADSENPEIRKVRAKVYAALVAARSSFDRNAIQMRRKASPGAPRIAPRLAPLVVDGADEYLEEYPGPALGIALLVGLGVGFVVSLRQ
jgi:ElaB/YqjD/DUF883 family membrane-anchored ribosome-binding protein